MDKFEFPVVVKEGPYWKVRFKPLTPQLPQYETSELKQIVENNSVKLRGWDYPHCPRKKEWWQHQQSFLEAFGDYGDEIEYWRMYRSHQFIHFFRVREALDTEWARSLKETLLSHLNYFSDLPAITGCMDVVNVLYSVTEIFEFASRLSANNFYSGAIEITIEIHGVKDFALTVDRTRSWSNLYKTNLNIIKMSKEYSSVDFIGKSRDLAMIAAVELFRQFNWENPSTDVLWSDQTKLLDRSRS